MSAKILEPQTELPSVLLPNLPQPITKQEIRKSLKASTLDGVFAAIFSSITGGVLLTNFLLRVGANSLEIGLLSSIPMLLNLLQPLGAYFADRVNSRHNYCLWIFGASRLLWLALIGGIAWVSWFSSNSYQLLSWTLAIVFATNILSALGGASWVSWMAAIVPHRLRGRYFGLRNSAASLTSLVCVPLFGLVISVWPSGTVQGYGVVLFLGIIAGLVSLGCQYFMVDVNPLLPYTGAEKKSASTSSLDEHKSQKTGIFNDTNFLKFLTYFGLWTFAVNLSSPFFYIYLLNDLSVDLSWVTLYNSIVSGANLVMLVLWGKLADRIGNRPLLLLVGLIIAVSPLFWLGIGADQLSLLVWLPLIHVINGGAGAAIDLCNNNIQMEVAPVEKPSEYFAIAAAIAGVSGGLGTAAGGFLAQLDFIGGLPGLFALSAIVRLLALLPLVFVREPRSQSVVAVIKHLIPWGSRLKIQQAVEVAD